MTRISQIWLMLLVLTGGFLFKPYLPFSSPTGKNRVTSTHRSDLDLASLQHGMMRLKRRNLRREFKRAPVSEIFVTPAPLVNRALLGGVSFTIPSFRFIEPALRPPC